MMFFGIFPLFWIFIAFLVISNMSSRRIRINRLSQSSDYQNLLSGQGSANSEAKIYRLAAKKGGAITVSDVVVALGISPAKAEELLESITDNVRVKMNVLDDGVMVYEFMELKRR